MNLEIVIAFDQMNLMLTNFKIIIFFYHGAIVTSETQRYCNIFLIFSKYPFYM
jgi:hypothetical protein